MAESHRHRVGSACADVQSAEQHVADDRDADGESDE
jgi:hypothetical protein